MSPEAIAAWCGVAVTLVLSIASLVIANRSTDGRRLITSATCSATSSGRRLG
jgi:hypothetical protein